MILTKEHNPILNIPDAIDSIITSKKLNEALFLVPTNRKARHLKKEIISGVPGNSTGKINIETLTTLTSGILNRKYNFKTLSDASASVFIKQAVNSIELRYFKVYNGEIPHGTLDRLKNVISEYKRHGITPENLRNSADELDSKEKQKALDIADIYEIFKKKCYSTKTFEIGDIYEELLNLNKNEFEKYFRDYLPEVQFIFADEFIEFTHPEIKILSRISDIKNVHLYINFDYNKDNKLLFGHLNQCYSYFEQEGFTKIFDTSIYPESNYKVTLKENLFNLTPVKKESRKVPEQDKILLLKCDDRETEVEMISRAIKKLLKENNAEPHRICVAFNKIQNYSVIIRDVFRKNGLPINLTDRFTLANNNAVNGIINFLEIIESDFFYQNILRALNNNLLTTSDISASNLYKAAVELKIIAGKKNWKTALEEAVETEKYTLYGDEPGISFAQAKRDFDKLVEFLKPFENLSQEFSIEEFDKCLREFIYKSGLPFKILSDETDKNILEENIRAFEKFIDTLDEIFFLLSEEYGKETKFKLSFFIEQLRTITQWTRYNTKEKSGYGITITTLDEIRGLKFDYLFIGGLCEGDLPTRYNPEIFFSGKYKKGAMIHQLEERYLFYKALCSWDKQLYLSYPLTDNGRELIKSSFLNELESLFDIKEVDMSELNEFIYSEEEWLMNYGRGQKCQYNFSRRSIDLIKTAIEIEATREQNQESFEYNGFINSATMNKYRSINKGNVFSVSQLETYARCPFKYFVESILMVEAESQPTEDVEAREYGNLLHYILFKFYESIKKNSLDITNDRNKAEELLFSIAENTLGGTLFRSPFSFFDREKILGINNDRKQSVLYKFLEKEIEYAKNGFRPAYFEISFGRKKLSDVDKELSTPDAVEIAPDVKLSGKIDRIDICDNAFDIIDYKTGNKTPTKSDLQKGLSLQLPLYAHIASQLLKNYYSIEFNNHELYIYTLKYNSNSFGKNPLPKFNDRTSNNEKINNAIEKSKEFFDGIQNGKFHVSTLPNRQTIVCNYCNLSTVCRVKNY
ncbi:PD-(D/E)XK nuclease family protein [Melioribacter sp. OK-6-Me]|uniref:PD-(D/E)XK nuclease family protein n=1 Tax=unclassified Melioribacter TaxID=2627329 RepID=UPI003EDA90B6